MTWFGWVLIAFLSWSALLTVSSVGNPRPATSTQVAVVTVVLAAAFIAGIVTVGTGSL